MPIDKITLPNGMEALEATEGLERDPEEMIILLTKKINEIIDKINELLQGLY